ncbi:DoxX family protein [Ktedonosporobacter rubrisoli]|uniref:DoxX family protein n=1 Tax=Ktedonosporobacter rubrisoli TaxID=2509675 RepID=UPI003BF60541
MYFIRATGSKLADVASLVLRIVLACVIFPHATQKFLGWFGGHGFQATLFSFEHNLKLPFILALLAILAEFFGTLGVFSGLLTRLSALGIGTVMVVAALTVHLKNGFFMNWGGQKAGEGIEYFLLAVGIALALLILGGGKWSLDYALFKLLNKEKKREHSLQEERQAQQVSH